MFTGIIEELGTVVSAGTRLVIECQTVLSDASEGFEHRRQRSLPNRARLNRAPLILRRPSPETLARTNLGDVVPPVRASI